MDTSFSRKMYHSINFSLLLHFYCFLVVSTLFQYPQWNDSIALLIYYHDGPLCQFIHKFTSTIDIEWKYNFINVRNQNAQNNFCYGSINFLRVFIASSLEYPSISAGFLWTKMLLLLYVIIYVSDYMCHVIFINTNENREK